MARRSVPAEADHPDLFWALQGGGGDFAAVTTFEFRAHTVGPMILGGMMVYPWADAPAAFRAARDLMEGAPEELTTFVTLITAPPADPFPPEVQGGPALAVAMAWTGDTEEGERVVASLRAKCPPAVDLMGPMPYVALQGMLDQTAPHGLNYYDRAHYLTQVSDEFIETLLSGFEEVSTPLSHVITGWMGGAIDRVAPGATAFGHRGANALTWLIGCSGEDPIAPAADWVRSVWERTAQFADEGVYVNALDTGRSVREAYADGIWERLVEIKHRYDPDGVFAGNGIG